MNVTDIAAAFDAQAVHVEHATLTGWPSADLLVGLAEGELWVAKDLTAESCVRSTWISGRPMYAADWTAIDAQGRARAFRRLDRDWYVWLYHAAQRARQRLEQAQPETWRELAARFNALWSIACRWWGRAEVAELQRSYRLDARYAAPDVYIPARGVVLPQPGRPGSAAGQPVSVNAWPHALRMAHAAASARVLSEQHRITTDARGHYIGPADLTHEELIRTAIEVARQVADIMRNPAHGRIAA